MSSTKDKSTISLVKSVSFDMDDFTTLLKKIYPNRKYPETAIECMWDYLKDNADDEGRCSYSGRRDYKYNVDESDDFTDEWENRVRDAAETGLGRESVVFYIRYNKEDKLVLVDPAGEITEMEATDNSTEEDGQEYYCERDCIGVFYYDKTHRTSVQGQTPKYDGESLDDEVIVIVD